MDQQKAGGGFVRRRRNITPLGDLLRESKDPSVETMAVLSGLKRLWAQLVGERLALMSFPYRLKDGVLFVAVRDALWISELPYLKDDILARFAPLNDSIKDIRFTLAKSAPQKNKPSVVMRELTTEELQWIDGISALISDPAQKENFRAALKSWLGGAT